MVLPSQPFIKRSTVVAASISHGGFIQKSSRDCRRYKGVREEVVAALRAAKHKTRINRAWHCQLVLLEKWQQR